MNNIKQALESAIEAIESNYELNSAKWKLKAALAEIEKCEPVAWGHIGKQGCGLWHEKTEYYSTPLYTSPQPREWLELSDEDINDVWDDCGRVFPDLIIFAKAIEAKLKQLNTKGES